LVSSMPPWYVARGIKLTKVHPYADGPS
jgi:hypothetical protein